MAKITFMSSRCKPEIKLIELSYIIKAFYLETARAKLVIAVSSVGIDECPT